MSLSASDSLRVILFTIDGLHWEAPVKLKIPTLNALMKEGTYIKKSYMIIPHHPTVGEYSKYNSCSFPNPMLHEGTIFISPQNKMVQEKISTKHQTAFVVNTTAYRSVARGFTTTIMDHFLSDSEVVETAIRLLKDQDIRFMRIHLQSPGVMGTSVALHSQDKSYNNNIWGEGSPYISAIENADKYLGQLVSFLKKSGKWENTVLIVTSDHGQSNNGWHPMLDEDSWKTPLLFAGKEIAQNQELSYFEHIDIAPTILWLLGIDTKSEDGGGGKVIKKIKTRYRNSAYVHPQYIKTINQQIREYSILHAYMVIEASKNNYIANIIASLENENLTPEPFYHHDRILSWHKAGSIEHIIKANDVILSKMRTHLDNNNHGNKNF
ncbi:MAG: sulfatase-like hydrolase/transferase [Proteiniphilum sp.]|jgi:hypothetical protein